MRILVVEDERKIAEILAASLAGEHHEVAVAPTGEDGFYRANAEAFDLVLLDLMLPGRSGLEILQTLRQRRRPSEVVRLKASDLELDVVARRASRADRLLDLTTREFELLEYLLRHQGHLVSREMLAQEVWREPRRATPLDNVIDVQIARLRKKVDSDGAARLIHTIRGVGFVLREGEP